jgi:histidinol phosphatase-like PHP family hydrolase
MKIDLHVHSSERSPCGKSTDEEQVRAAIAAGLDGIFFTDHHAYIDDSSLIDLNRCFAPFQVFRGIEVSVQDEDFLVLGIFDYRLTHNDWNYRKLFEFVREHNGYIVLAHPYRYQPEINLDFQTCRPDAIEICSVNTAENNRSRIQEIAQYWHLPTVCNSDAHTAQSLGSFFNILEEAPQDEAALLAMLRAGRFRCSCG